MNELRMYVERLFEGRVLTAENIELKEEIYGNLVARYEDYLAGGMDEADALKKTKESITSIEDVLEGGDRVSEARLDAADATDESDGTDESTEQAAGVPAGGKMPVAPDVVAETQTMPTVSAAVSQEDGGISTNKQGTKASDEGGTIAGMPKKKFFAIVGVVIAVLVVLGVGGSYALEYMDERADRAEDIAEAQAEQQALKDSAAAADSQATTPDTSSNAGQGSAAASGGNASANASTSQQYRDPEDQREYEATTGLLAEIDAVQVSTLQSAASGSMTGEQLLRALPMGNGVDGVSMESSGATLNVSYANVSEDYDGDAVDAVLVYNVAAVFSAYSDLQTVNVSLHEQYDHPQEAGYYVFTRANLENGIASASSNAITQLNSSLFESSESWNQVREYVAGHRFADYQMELADIYD